MHQEIDTRWKLRFENYKKVYISLEKSIIKYNEDRTDNFIQDSVIQRYEYTIELAWKTIKDYLEEQGFTDVSSPKSVIRKAYEERIISDGEGWIKALNDRNRTSHAYEETMSKEVTTDIVDKHYLLFRDLFLFFRERIDE